MEKLKIQISSEVVDYLNELITLLFFKEYFSFEFTAQQYVQKIYDFIENNLSTFPHKYAPKSLKKFGSYFVFYKANNRTTWYIFFEKKGHSILITHITNNHIHDINLLNE